MTPNGLWQVTVRGAYVFGGAVTFGVNQGKFNFGVEGGVRLGFELVWDNEDRDTDVNDPNPFDGVVCSTGSAKFFTSAGINAGELFGLGTEIGAGTKFESDSNEFLGVGDSYVGLDTILNANVAGLNKGVQNEFGIQNIPGRDALRNQTTDTPLTNAYGGGVFVNVRFGLTF